MGKVFVSYRKSDSLDTVGRLVDHLRRHFLPEEVFFDEGSPHPRGYLARAKAAPGLWRRPPDLLCRTSVLPPASVHRRNQKPPHSPPAPMSASPPSNPPQTQNPPTLPL